MADQFNISVQKLLMKIKSIIPGSESQKYYTSFVTAIRENKTLIYDKIDKKLIDAAKESKSTHDMIESISKLKDEVAILFIKAYNKADDNTKDKLIDNLKEVISNYNAVSK